MTDMTKADRDQLVRLAKNRAKQAEADVDARMAVLYTEVIDQMTAEYEVQDALWADAVIVAEEATAKANDQIRRKCAELGIPAGQAPQLHSMWSPRGRQFSNRERRAELEKLAKARLAALAKEAKVRINNAALQVEEQLILGGFESDAARAAFELLPSAEELMPRLSLQELGVTRWQPPEDIAGQLTTPMTTSGRLRRRVKRAIEANPDESDIDIARIAGIDVKTVAAFRREEVLAITRKSHTQSEPTQGAETV